MCRLSDVQNWAWRSYLYVPAGGQGEECPGVKTSIEQKIKAMQTATLGLLFPLSLIFFVWHIDALTQFILINMSSINVCSNRLTPWRSKCVSLQRKVSQTCTPQKKYESNSVFTVMVTDMLTHTRTRRTRTYTIVKIKSTNRSTLFHEMRIGRTDLHWLALT